jgi:hypothetical protein
MRGWIIYVKPILLITLIISSMSISQSIKNHQFTVASTNITDERNNNAWLESNTGPTFDFYTKRVDARIPWDNLTLDFDATVSGPKPITEVIFSYAFSNENSWNNKTMTMNSFIANGYRCTHNFILPDRENAYSWSVKYYAQDADGHYCTTELVNVTLKWQAFSDTPRSTKTTSPPNIIYEYETTGHTIEWKHLSQQDGQYYDAPEQYELRKDGILIEWMQWPKDALVVNIDGLLMGTHRYQLLAIAGTPWKYTYWDEVTVDVVSGVPGEGSNPSMKYYLKAFYSGIYPFDNFSLPVRILVEDPDGVEAVFAIYSFNNGPWSNISMTEDDNDPGWYETSLDFPGFSQTSELHTCAVKYTAKDTLGNWAMTPLCTYSILATTTTADISVDVYDTPDLWYLVGTTAHTVTWKSIGGLSYSLYEDGHLIEKNKWSGPVTINVDGHECGNHVYELHVSGGMWSDFDEVIVHVVDSIQDIPFGAYTDSVEPNTLLGPNMPYLSTPFLVGVAILGFMAITITVFARRHLKKQSSHVQPNSKTQEN